MSGGQAPPSAYAPAAEPAYYPPYPHPEPREYHQMLRTWTYRWWKPVVGTALLGAGALVVLPLVLFPVLMVGVLIENGTDGYSDALFSAGTLGELTPSGLLYLNLVLAALIPWTWLLVRYLHHLRPRWLSSVVPKLRWRFLVVCLGLSLVALLAQVAVGAMLPNTAGSESLGEPNPLTGTTIALALVVLLTTPFQAAGEEYAFRGYLLQAVGSLAQRRWLSIVLTALLFAVAHLQFSPPLFFDRFMFGLIAAWLVIRTGGLEAAIALHVLNNYLALGLAVFLADLQSALDPGDISWWNVPVTLTQSLVYAGLVAWLARVMNLTSRTRPPLWSQ